MTPSKTQETPVPFKINGWIALIAAFIVLGYGIYCVYSIFESPESSIWAMSWRGILTLISFFVILSGLDTLQKNQASVYTFMGKYMGTLRGPGFFWVPFWWGRYSERNLSLITIKIPELTVNDKKGNPILIGCDIFCAEEDTHVATFDISDLDEYLPSKGEVALRKIAMTHPMDAQEGIISLRGNTEDILKELQVEITKEFEKAGYSVDSAAITKLSYAPEIAAVMLQKQQAEALIDARETIVKGAIHIVQDTIKQLEAGENKFNEAEKQRLTSNLLITLCSHQAVAPVVNVGSTN